MDSVQRTLGHPPPFHKAVPRAFDVLGRNHAWTADKQARLAVLQAIKPTRTAAIVATAKNEGIYLLEWLAHHRAVGFEHAFLYTNGNRDGSDALLDLLARHGLVTVLQNDLEPDVSPQVKAYEHSVLHLPELRDFEWAGYFDLDEFLVPAAEHGHSVTALLRAADARHPDAPPGAVHVHWRWFGSGGRIGREPGLVHEQFVHSRPHPAVKSLVRLRDVRSMRRIHVPELTGPPGVDSTLAPVSLTEGFSSKPAYGGAQLNHYYHKSFAEFCVKHDRGEGSSPGGAGRKGMDTFFHWDVPPASATLDPMPDALRMRAGQELAALHALPGMSAVLRHVEDRHRTLEASLLGDRLLPHHAACKAQAADGAPPSVPPPAPVTCLPDLAGEHYHTVLHRLHAVLQPQAYLEVGVADGATLALAHCASIAVDTDFSQLGANLAPLLARPSMSFFCSTSDEFFAGHSPSNLLGNPLDMAFLDGMHHCEFLLRDFANTERSCRRGSLVVMHDCLPVDAAIATRTPGELPPALPHRQGWWAGDVWRFALLLRRRRPDLDVNVLDADPTGLVLVTNLSPRSTMLLDAYDAHVAEMLSWDLATMGLDRLHGELGVQPTASLAMPEQLKARYRL